MTYTEAKTNIGKCAAKISRNQKRGSKKEPKPFKSGLKINTITGVIEHPIMKTPAYTFLEDDSFVECSICTIVNSYSSNFYN